MQTWYRQDANWVCAPGPRLLLQIKPPICMTLEEADRMVDAVAAVLDSLSPAVLQALIQASRDEVAALQPQRAKL